MFQYVKEVASLNQQILGNTSSWPCAGVAIPQNPWSRPIKEANFRGPLKPHNTRRLLPVSLRNRRSRYEVQTGPFCFVTANSSCTIEGSAETNRWVLVVV